jgi:molecular chaperone GrpE
MTSQRKTPPKRPAKRHQKKPDRKGAEKKADPGAETENRVENLEARAKELNDKLLRAMAEMENVRRRAEREVQDARAYAVTGFARELLSVSDNFQRALKALPGEAREKDEFKPFIEGIELTGRELSNIFERHGIKIIKPKRKAFDHNLHQAMFEVETSEFPPGTVMEVIQEGYTIRDRLLRPAMVGVARAPKEDQKQEVPES